MQGIGWGVAAFLISVVLVAYGFLAYAKSFLQSERFHRMVQAKLGEVLQAEVELGEVRWEGSGAYADRVRAQGYEEAGFSQMGLAGLRAELDLSVEQFKRRVWKVREVAISQLDVRFSESGRLKGKRPAAPAGGMEVEGPAGQGAKGLLAELIPREVEVEEVRLSNLNLYWETAESRVSATGMQTVAKPTSGERAYAVRSRGGVIQGSEIPKLLVEVIDLRWKGKELYLTEAKLRGEEGVNLSLEGDIRLGEEGNPGSMLLNAEVTQLSLGQILADRETARVKGDVSISARIEGDPGEVRNSRQEGRITLRNGMVETMPILEMLAGFTQSKRFEKIALRDGGGANFVREGGRTVLSGIDFQSDGLGKLTGDLVIEEGNLAGVLQLGVIPGTLAWIPTAEQKIFTVSREGHLWTDVVVSGTVENPQHDLTPRLASAGVEAAVDALGRILGRGGETPGSEGGAKEGTAVPTSPGPVGDALDLGRELLKGMLR